MHANPLPTIVLAAVVAGAIGVPGCVGPTGGHRKPGAGAGRSASEGPCARLDQDVTIRSAADMATLPRTGCYDIYGKLTLQGQAITSLAALGGLNSVDELDLDHTGVTTIDTGRPLGIYGKLTLTGNSRLASLAQLSFETASTGILIDGNPALATLDALGLDDPRLSEVDGDLVITGNAALESVPLGHLTKLTGGLTITGNAALKIVDLARLATTGSIELADNPQLGSLTGLGATTIAGDLAIRNNAALGSLGTMTALYRVTGSVTIDSDPALVKLAAFTTSLKFIDQSLTITNNRALTDLGALKHLQLVGAIDIAGNPSLVTCRAVEIDRCVPHPTAAVITDNSDVACNWQCE